MISRAVFCVGLLRVLQKCGVDAFSVRASSQKTCTQLSMSSPPTLKTSVIYADDTDFDFDPGQGGVRLAKDSALRLSGTVPHGAAKPGAKPNSFIRYTKLTQLNEHSARMQEILKEQSAQILATGFGQEIYQDPGEGFQQVIELGPLSAAKDLLNTLKSSGKELDESMKHVVNIVGGDDLQVLEVLDALGQLRLTLGVSRKMRMEFSSLSHPSFPLQQVTMTLVAMPDDTSTNLFRDGMEKSVAGGLIFFQNGKYFTVVEDDINPDLL